MVVRKNFARNVSKNKLKDDFVYKKQKRVMNVVLTLVIIQTGLIIYLSINNFIIIPDEINALKKDLRDIETTNFELGNQVGELSKSLMETNIDLSKKIGTIQAATSADFSGIVENSLKSVVSIRTNIAQGTGFIVSKDGFVVTNAHVLSGARYADAILSNSGIEGMDLIGYNLTLDIALLKIDGTYEPLVLGDSNDLRVGEKVIAIGNPLGLGFSVSEGIVSGVHRPGFEEDLFAYIQTDAALNPGNSGGPLINTNGKAIGINNFKARGESIGFALESNYLKAGVNDIAITKMNRTIL